MPAKRCESPSEVVAADIGRVRADEEDLPGWCCIERTFQAGTEIATALWFAIETAGPVRCVDCVVRRRANFQPPAPVFGLAQGSGEREPGDAGGLDFAHAFGEARF